MTTIDRLAVPDVRGGWRTPAWLYRLISSPVLRAVLGWDLPRYDVRTCSSWLDTGTCTSNSLPRDGSRAPVAVARR
jgi:hypothetical protein